MKKLLIIREVYPVTSPSLVDQVIKNIKTACIASYHHMVAL